MNVKKITKKQKRKLMKYNFVYIKLPEVLDIMMVNEYNNQNF